MLSAVPGLYPGGSSKLVKDATTDPFAKKRRRAKAKNSRPRKRTRRNPNSWGTSYFTSRGAAERYYKGYGYDDVKAAVKRKIADGEIHIGKPPLKAGQRLTTTDGGKRYMITEANSRKKRKARKPAKRKAANRKRKPAKRKAKTNRKARKKTNARRKRR